MSSWRFGLGVMLTAFACGCGSSASNDTLMVTGHVTATSKGFDNPRVVAVSAKGNALWSYIDAKGNFSLSLPKGTSYRILVTNQIPGDKRAVLGHVVVNGTSGKTSWIAVPEGGALNLGTLGAGAAAPAGGVQTMSEAEDGKSAESEKEDGDEDRASHEDEHEDEHVCGGRDKEHEDTEAEGDDDELHSDRDVDHKYADKDDDDGDDEKGDKEREDKEVSKSCGGGIGGPGAPPATTASGPRSSGAACVLNADCSSGLACFASRCTTVLK